MSFSFIECRRYKSENWRTCSRWIESINSDYLVIAGSLSRIKRENVQREDGYVFRNAWRNRYRSGEVRSDTILSESNLRWKFFKIIDNLTLRNFNNLKEKKIKNCVNLLFEFGSKNLGSNKFDQIFYTYTPIKSNVYELNYEQNILPFKKTLLQSKPTCRISKYPLKKTSRNLDPSKLFTLQNRDACRFDEKTKQWMRESIKRKKKKKEKTTEELVTRKEKFGERAKGREGSGGVKANSRCLRWELGSGGSPSPGLWNEKAIQFCPCSDAVDIRHPSASRHQKQRRLLGFALPHITTNHPQNNRFYIYTHVHPLQLIDTGGNNKVINKNPPLTRVNFLWARDRKSMMIGRDNWFGCGWLLSRVSLVQLIIVMEFSFFFFFPYFDSRFLNDRRFDRGEKILVFFSFRGIDRGLIIIRKGNNCNYLWWNQFCVSWNNFEEWIFRDIRYSFFF